MKRRSRVQGGGRVRQKKKSSPIRCCCETRCFSVDWLNCNCWRHFWHSIVHHISLGGVQPTNSPAEQYRNWVDAQPNICALWEMACNGSCERESPECWLELSRMTTTMHLHWLRTNTAIMDIWISNEILLLVLRNYLYCMLSPSFRKFTILSVVKLSGQPASQPAVCQQNRININKFLRKCQYSPISACSRDVTCDKCLCNCSLSHVYLSAHNTRCVFHVVEDAVCFVHASATFYSSFLWPNFQSILCDKKKRNISINFGVFDAL